MAETFGFDGIGSAANLGANSIWVSGPFSPESDGILTNISYYGRDSGDKVKLALYDYADDSLIAGSDTEELALNANLGWVTGSCSNPPAIYSAKQYWIAALLQKGCQGAYKANTGTFIKYLARTYTNGFPATLGTLSNWGTNYSLNILGIYEPAAGGVTHEGSATLSGVGTLSGIGRGIFIGKSTLSGVGSLGAIGQRIVTGVVTLVGTGLLTAKGIGIFASRVTLSGVGGLVGVGTIIGEVLERKGDSGGARARLHSQGVW